MYRRVIKNAFFIVLICNSYFIHAQAIIKGRVINSLTEAPVEFSNVYINNSSTGGITDLNGYYEFETELLGQLEVRASHVGYLSESRVLQINEGETRVVNFKLVEEQIELADVSVEVEKDHKWARDFKKFQRNFLGNERNIQIENAFILDFARDEYGNLTADASEPMILVNSYLGYKINYELVSFKLDKRMKVSYKGYGRYEPMNDPDLQARWERNRLINYNGSLMHFLRALTQKSLAEEGFSMYLTDELREDSQTNIRGVTEDEILIETDYGMLIKTDGKLLKVYYDRGSSTYNNYSFESETFWLEPLNRDIRYSAEGFLLDPLQVIQHGSLSEKRFEKELPSDYRSPDQIAERRSRFKNLFTHLEDYLSEQPREKVYLDFVNSEPVPGGKLFFDATVAAGPYHQRTPLSNTLYVELIDPGCQLATYTTVRVDNGRGNGAISLPTTLYSGEYTIRAYTEWMKNFDQGYYFTSPLVLGIKNVDLKPHSIDFFPTSESLVEGVAQSVPFKVTNIEGDGVVSEIELYTNKEELLATVETDTLGTGIIPPFKPKKGVTYQAKIKGNDAVFELPVVQRNGTCLKIAEANNSLMLTIENKRQKNKSGLLIGHSHGLVRFATDLDLSENLITFSIKKAVLFPGITHFVILDEDFKEISSFPVFINQASQRVEDIYSVLDLSLNTSDSISLLHYLMIDSELMGESTWDYNSSPTSTFLLTSDWIKFPWDQIASRKFQELEYEPEKGLGISGYVMEANSKKRLNKGMIHLLVGDQASAIYSSKLDSVGGFSFNSINYSDTTSLVFSYTMKDKPKPFKIHIDSSNYLFQRLEGSRTCGDSQEIAANLRQNRGEDELTFNEDFTLLSEVEITAKKADKRMGRREGQIYRDPTQTIVIDSLGQFAGTIYDILLSGRISSGIGAGVDSVGTPGLFIRKLQNSTSGNFALVILDGTYLTDITPLYTIPANEIDYVDILSDGQRGIYGQQAFGGVIIIETKKISGDRPFDPTVQVERIKGYTVY